MDQDDVLPPPNAARRSRRRNNELPELGDFRHQRLAAQGRAFAPDHPIYAQFGAATRAATLAADNNVWRGARDLDYPLYRPQVVAAPREPDWDLHEEGQRLRNLYYQRGHSAFVLRFMRHQTLGVTGQWWNAALELRPGDPNTPIGFTTFEMVDISNLRARLNLSTRSSRILYSDVNLPSRAPDGNISLSVPTLQEQNDIGHDIQRLYNNAVPVNGFHVPFDAQNPPRPFTALVHSIVMMLCDITSHRSAQASSRPLVLHDATHDFRISISYQVFSKDAGEFFLLEESDNFRPEAIPVGLSPMDNMLSLAMVIWNMLLRMFTRLLQERYDDNGLHLLRPEIVRLVMAEAPEVDGTLYEANPFNVVVPMLEDEAGGCLSVRLPTLLAEIAGPYIVSHDVVVNGFVDNNCGIRAAMLALGIVEPPYNARLFRHWYDMATTARNSVHGIPPYVKLTPNQVYQVIQRNIGRSYPCSIWLLPTPQEPEGHLYSNLEEFDWEGHQPSPLLLVLSHGHYYNVRDVADMTHEEVWSAITAIRYCTRCMTYFSLQGGGRVSHILETPTPEYPPCKPRGDLSRVPRALRRLEAQVHEPSRTTVKPIAKIAQNKLTERDRIGFMDFETWRPDRANGIHFVYAVGWLKSCSDTCKIEDVQVFRKEEDDLEEDLALYKAIDALIQYVSGLENSGAVSKAKPYYLYFYNGSGFDNLFLLHVLVSRFGITPTEVGKKDGKVMTLSFLDGCIVIRDLFLFTLCSLDSASKVYNVPANLAKGEFDHDSIVTAQDIYDQWPVIDEYLRKDLTALNYVAIGFFNASHAVFGLDPCKRITASQLSYEYWISTLTQSERALVTIPSDYPMYEEVRKAYYGGRVFPQVKYFRSTEFGKDYADLKDYLIDLDVVSLYPTAMTQCVPLAKDFPTLGRNIPLYFCGEPVYYDNSHWSDKFDGMQRLLMTDHVGNAGGTHLFTPSMEFWARTAPPYFDLARRGAIVCVDVSPPPGGITIPLLPHKNASGDTDWDMNPHASQSYILEEILDAIYYGYRVTKLHYFFEYPERLAVFDAAINTLMDGKQACQRGDPKRDQYKLGANSIYGKTAQLANATSLAIIYPEDFEEFMKKHYVLSVEPICNGQFVEQLRERRLNRPAWVGTRNVPVYDIPVEAMVVTYKPDVILPTKPTYLGAQVTAYARIHMNYTLSRMALVDSKNSVQQLYYTDTDSEIVHASSLNGCHDLFGKATGLLDDELEGGKIIEFVALAPKTYALTYVTPDNKRFMKIRAKGIPHTKATLTHNPFPVADVSNYLTDGQIDSAKLPLKKRLYSLTYQDGTVVCYEHLSPDIMKQLLDGNATHLSVYFSNLKRTFFGNHELGHVSGIAHAAMSRSLHGPVWWDGTPDNPMPHRFALPDYPNVTFPKGWNQHM